VTLSDLVAGKRHFKSMTKPDKTGQIRTKPDKYPQNGQEKVKKWSVKTGQVRSNWSRNGQEKVYVLFAFSAAKTAKTVKKWSRN
jgi:hypothetical protein